MKRVSTQRKQATAQQIGPDAITVLRTAAECIDNRANQRDQPDGERSMARTVATFNTLTGHNLSERDGWVFMTILKLSRAQAGAHVLDDYVDGAAYLALAAESVEVNHG